MQTALLWRQGALWALTRVVHAALSMVAVQTVEVSAANALLRPQPAVVLLCMALGAVDITRRGERLLLGNLGISRWRLTALLAGPPLVAEAVVAIVGSV